MTYKAGALLDTHAHKYPHLLLVASGTVLVKADGVEREVQGPGAVQIPAGVAHDLVAKTDALAACVHICRLPNGEQFPFAWEPSAHSYDEARLEL